MKKLSVLIFSMLLAVSVAACSGTQTSSRTEETSAQNTQTEQTTEQETASEAAPSTITITSLDGHDQDTAKALKLPPPLSGHADSLLSKLTECP